MGRIVTNVKQAVPFFMVNDMTASLRFYVDGLGFAKKMEWKPRGTIEWCTLELDDVALMLQEYRPKDDTHPGPPEGTRGLGVSICFICEDAIAFYHEARHRGVDASLPFVGNRMWVTSVTDPDGYRLDFESLTDAPEQSVYSESEKETHP